jgi:alpha-tubulin suppressor-like RCC1 family protein
MQGQLGDGTNADRSAPVRVATPTSGVAFTEVHATDSYSVALGTDGNAYAWGWNYAGQLGNGTTDPSATPVQVTSPAPGVTFTKLFLGNGQQTFGFGSDGQLYAWGANFQGQVGNGTTTEALTPVPVLAPAPGVKFIEIAVGGGHVLGLGSDGNTYGWGRNGDGQIGNGTTINSLLPVLVAEPAPGVTFTQVQAGGQHSVALGSDGKTYAWGENSAGQLGNGTSLDSLTPTPVSSPSPGVSFTSVVSGYNYSFAFGSDGNAYAWGLSQNGQLGNGAEEGSALPGPLTGKATPVMVNAPAPGVTFTQLAAASTHALGIGSDGKTYAWGDNYSGQLGNGATAARELSAVQVLMKAVVTGVKFDGLAGTGLKNNSDGTWSVVTPAHAAGPVDVSVEWTLNGVPQEPVVHKAGYTYKGKAAGPCSAPRPVAVFEDTPVDHKFYKEIDWMECMNYSTGWRQPAGKPLYKPADNLSREAMAAFIFRMEAPKNYQAPKVSPFADMKPGDVFYKEIAWMYEAKLSTGWAEPSGKPTFRPKDKLSREAMAAFIYRMEAPKGYAAPAKSPMADMKPGMKFYKEISWMYDEDLTTGNKVGNTKEYWPKDELSRQAMAAFIHRLVTNYRA